MSTLTYKCIKAIQRHSQGAPTCLLFSAKAGDIEKWAAIERFTHQAQEGPQRLEKPYKVKAIRDYFSAGANNIIPTAVVIGLLPGKSSIVPIQGCDDLYELTLTCEEDPEGKAGTVVDGQHRILGMKAYDPEMLVNIIALPEIDEAEVAFQFLVINNKAARVSSDHLRAIALHYKEEDLSQRLQNVKLKLDPNLMFVGFVNNLDESPFKGLLKLPNNAPEASLVPPTAIEEAISYIKQQKLQEFAQDDMTLGLFFTVWNVIRSGWEALWNGESKLLTKVSVICLTQFFVDTLLARFDWGDLDIFDLTKVESESKKILSVLNPQFWSPSTEWTAKGLDTSAGRKVLMDALDQMVRNARQKVPWHSDISMIRVAEEAGA